MGIDTGQEPGAIASAQPGDIILVEGRSELSRIIQVLSNGTWTHAALYVGDRLIRPDCLQRATLHRRFGDHVCHLVVEAFVGEGVIAARLRQYQEDNIRFCRPFGMSNEDRELVIESVVANLGNHYDEQNIMDLALMLLPLGLNPFKKKYHR